MRPASAILFLFTVLAARSADAAEDKQLVRAAPLRGDPDWSPRRLFNAALSAEEQGNRTLAVQLYMSARLAARDSIADELYARGAGLRLVRILAGYDDDAAAAAAMLVTKEAGPRATTDLAPLIRTLMRRFERSDDRELTYLTGTIGAIRVKSSGEAYIELHLDDAVKEGEKRTIVAEGPVGPFSAGDPVRVLAKRDVIRALTRWRLVAMAHARADGWQILSVSGLPGEPGPAYGALLTN
jgi:hypothetical protein